LAAGSPAASFFCTDGIGTGPQRGAAVRSKSGEEPSVALDLQDTLPARAAGSVLRVLSVAMLALLVAAGLLGSQDPFANILPTFVWVIWWVGLAYVSAFLGDVWSVLNPWAIVGDWAGRLRARLRTAPVRPLAPPVWLGVWPGVLLFWCFGWAELVWPENAVPARLACAILLYSAITWSGMALFGVRPWLACGEAFALFFGLFGRFAPLDLRNGALRPYAAGLLDAAVSPSMLAFVVLALAMVSFDGLAETPLWAALTGETLALLHQAGLLAPLGYVAAGALIKTAGLVLTPLTFLGVYLLVCRLTCALVPDGWTTLRIARTFVLTLVPIAIAYHLAHYLSYLLIHGQAIIALASDPFGRGWDLFGTARYEVDIGVVGARFIWITSVVAIVAGHVFALWLAHKQALACFGGQAARRSQIPTVVLMVGYTMLSLWILAQPIVET
jgi:hypothetical protein